MKNLLKKQLYNPLLMVYLALSSCAFILSFIIEHPNSIHGVSTFWVSIVLPQFVLFLILYHLKNRSINNPYIYLVTGALICWIGQIIVVAFGMSTGSIPIIESFQPDTFFQTAQYASISLFVLMLAGLMFSKSSSINTDHVKIEDKNLRFSMTVAGVFLSFMGAYSYLAPRWGRAVTTAVDGYADNFITSSASPIENILLNFGLFFIPGLLLVAIANKNSLRVRVFMTITFSVLIVLALTTGGRSDAILLVLAIFWLYTNEIRRLKKVHLVFAGFAGYIFMRISNALAEFRISDDKSISELVSLIVYGKSDGGGTVGNILNEFGFNIFSLHNTMSLVPSHQNFADGYTYFASMMAIIPSYFFGGYSFSEAAGLPEWLKNTLGLDYGPGFSIAAESYYNFGWFGIVAMFILGFILVKMFTNNARNADMRSLKNVFIATTLYATLFMARDTSLMLFRRYFYMVVVPTLIIYLIYQYRERRQRQENG